MSRIHVLEEYPVRNSSLKNLNPWLRNSSLKNVNTWGIPASEIWTPVEFDTQKPEPWIILAWKTLPRSLRNSSIKNLNPWGIPASKPWTCEELQTQILTLVDFQLQKYWYFRNSSLNCYPWGILGSKILTPEEFQSDYFVKYMYPWKCVPLKNSRSIKWLPHKKSRVRWQGLCTY